MIRQWLDVARKLSTAFPADDQFMKPIPFPEQTVTYAKNQPQYNPLPAYREQTAEGRVVFCWQLTWKERLRVLLGGVVWQEVLTFNQPLQPQLLGVDKPEMTKP